MHWLPTGSYRGLRIEHRALESLGAFTGGGWKLVWHTTEGRSIEGAYVTLRQKRAAPHFVIDHTGHVIQTIGLHHAGRALAHRAGTPETNRARAIQVECVGFAANTRGWSDGYYQHLADLFVLIKNSVPILNEVRHSFGSPRHLSGEGFVRAHGHLGHCHVPGNDHTDPGTGFRIHYLQSRAAVRLNTQERQRV